MTFEDVKRIRQNPTAEDVDNNELANLIDFAVDKQCAGKPVSHGITHFCPDCGRGVWEPYPFCENCGKKIDWKGAER